MIRAQQSSTLDETIPVSPDELERIADAAGVGVVAVGDSFYAVVVDRATERVRVYRAVA